MKEDTTDGRRIKEKKPQAVTGVGSKKAAAPSAAEQQIAQVERTFTNRWEW